MDATERRALLMPALRSARGRYTADRAAHLSGVPRSTIYDWAREDVLVPDYALGRPMSWSYRDLVYLRLLARLRQRGLKRDDAAAYVREVRHVFASTDDPAATLRIADRRVFLGDSTTDMLSGQTAFAETLHATQEFDLLEPLEGVTDHPTWGPDLIEPSAHTYISPNVMGGEPCVDSTRVPSASVLALVEDRGLTPSKIVRLYPGLTETGVEDAVRLEQRMRRTAA